MPNPNYDYIQQHPLQTIININWPRIRFLTIDLDIERRPTIEWIEDAPTEVEKAQRGAQVNDYVDLRELDPGWVGDWPFELIAFRYCSAYQQTIFDVDFTESGFTIEVSDDLATAPVTFSSSTGLALGGNPLHTNWSSTDQSNNPIELTGLPAFPLTFERTGFAAAFENASIFTQGPKFFAPQIEWDDVEGALIPAPAGSDAALISQPLSLVGAPSEALHHFKSVGSVTFKMRGIASDGAGNTEVGVGFAPEGGPVSGSAPPIETGYPSTFDQITINLADLNINWDGTDWRAIGATHEPRLTDPPAVPDYPGRMWVLFVRQNDPDY